LLNFELNNFSATKSQSYKETQKKVLNYFGLMKQILNSELVNIKIRAFFVKLRELVA